MVVEIKSTDTPEEVAEKLKAIKKKCTKEGGETPEQREARFDKYFGAIKFDGDPVELQRKWRDEWE